MRSSGSIPYHKGRVVGTFDVNVLSEGRVRVEVAARFSGKEYFGTAWLAARGTTVEQRYTGFRSRSLADASAAATAGLTEAAQAVALAWVAEHGEAFVEADLEAAERELASATKVVGELQAALVVAEGRVANAEIRVRVLGGAPS